MLFAISQHSPDIISECRHEIYAGYKGHRQRMPEEIAWALPPLTLLLEQMRIPTFKAC